MRNTIKTYLQPAFLICTATLAIAASGMSIAIQKFGIYLKKEPLPLKKPLDLLDESQLGPYKVISKSKIENEEVIEALGTEDYIQWLLEDTEAAADSPVRRCMIFITYYDLPDRVPHVPEECYAGGGYQKIASDSVTFEVSRAKGVLSPQTKKIPGKYLVFAGTESDHWHRNTKFSLLYLINVNGIYAGNREDARVVLNKNIFGKYSYFTKVELGPFISGIGVRSYPTKKEAVLAGQKLLSIILPILEKDHWPDWKD